MKSDTNVRERELAEAVREACLKATIEAYEDASIRGLCEEGAWECAVGAVRSIDLDAVIERRRDRKDTIREHPSP